MYAILKDKEVVPVDDIMEWAHMFADNKARIVEKTKIGEVEVSTVFLGIDHNFTQGSPLWFETMTFGDASEMQKRYATWEEAQAGHDEIVAMLRSRV